MMCLYGKRVFAFLLFMIYLFNCLSVCLFAYMLFGYLFIICLHFCMPCIYWLINLLVKSFFFNLHQFLYVESCHRCELFDSVNVKTK